MRCLCLAGWATRLPLKLQRLIHGQEELAPKRSAANLGLKDGMKLRVSLRPNIEHCLAPPMQIFVRGLNGGTSTLVTSPDDTSLDLMSKIHDRRGEHVQSLMYKEDSSTLWASINPYKIQLHTKCCWRDETGSRSSSSANTEDWIDSWYSWALTLFDMVVSAK